MARNDPPSARAALAAQLLGVQRAFFATARPRPLTAERCEELRSIAATPKYDGHRSLLLFDDLGAERETACGANELLGACPARPDRRLWVLDAETMADATHWVFDVLVAAGEDVRGLPLPDRLGALEDLDEAAARAFRRKTYATATAHTLSQVLRHLLQTTGQASDGLVLVDTLAPYWQAPLKFKTSVTSDFLLESEADGEQYLLLVGGRGATAPQPLLRDGKPCSLALTAAQRRRLGLGNVQRLHRSNGVIVECRSQKGTFVPVRRRTDRYRPNSRSTVLENLRLDDLGCTRPKWLQLALRCAPEHEVFRGWLKAVLRTLEGRFVAPGAVVLQLGGGETSAAPGVRLLRMASPGQEPQEAHLGVFGTDRPPRADVVLCLWCLGDFGRGLEAFARAVRETEARTLLCVYWTAQGRVASLGRFSLTTHGDTLALQLPPDPRTHVFGATDDGAAQRALEAEGLRVFPASELPRVPRLLQGSHSLHEDYVQLAQCVGLLAAEAPLHPRDLG